MKKVNVAELLKDCPTGMELDSPVWDNIVFEELDDDTIIISRKHCSSKVYLSRYGDLNDIDGKCIIFPKGKTTWEGFVPPCKFKDGDIVAHQNHMGTWIGIYHKHDYLNETFSSYCCIGRDGKFWASFNNDHGYDKTRFATEEEKQKLFKAIKANGYKWNLETKELEKLIQPKFKVGDWVVNKFGDVWHIDSFNSENYQVSNGDKYCYFLIEEQDKMHLWTINDAKNGDVIFYDSGWTCIFKCIHGIWYSSYCFITSDGEFHTGYEEHDIDATINGNAHPATEEQCRFLFQKIKEAGYKWNVETKTLEKLVEPKFKVGDKVRRIHTGETYIIGSINSNGYMYKNEGGVGFTFEDEGLYELVPNKFDISTLIPFESRVLARYCKDSKWIPTFWGSYDKEDLEYPYNCCGMLFTQCIPYESNEHLLGKTEDCIDFYKTWE
jgi:hypothetical protein